MEMNNEIKKIVNALEQVDKMIKDTLDQLDYEYDEDMDENIREIRLMFLNTGVYSFNHLLARMQYLMKPTKEGKLILKPNDRYKMNFWGLDEFTCGKSIDILARTDQGDMVWLDGYIEHSKSMGGYYFVNNSSKCKRKIMLEDGMRARIRL